MCTQAHARFSLYSGLDCSAETMALSDEKFLRIRHSCWGKTKRTCHDLVSVKGSLCRRISALVPLQRNTFGGASANLSDVDPALDDPRSDVRSELPVLQHRADHARRHRVKLRNGGPNGGGAVLVVLLVPLGPDGAQAVVRHDLFKQQLEESDGVMLA